MRKMLIILVVIMAAISIIPKVSYAHGHDQDREWRRHHEQVWKANEREWHEYDRQWAAHRGERHWREVHVRMWPEWYRWHRDHESYLNIRISPNSHVGASFELNFSN